MRTATPQLIAFLKTRHPMWVAELFAITLVNGTAMYLTSSDQPIVGDDGHTYSNTGMAVERSKLTMTNTAEVPDLEVKLFCDDATDINGVPVKLLIHNGGLDGAQLTLRRAFMPNPGNVAYGSIVMFTGRQSTIKLTGAGGTLLFKGANVLWNQYYPRNCYQAGCIHALYDAGCGLSQVDFTIASAVAAGANSANQIIWIGPANAAAYKGGILTFTSGAAAGITRTVQWATQTAIAPAYPLDILPAVGDTFNISMGCDYTISTCTNRFNNAVNYRGFPFIPDAYTAF